MRKRAIIASALILLFCFLGGVTALAGQKTDGGARKIRYENTSSRKVTIVKLVPKKNLDALDEGVYKIYEQSHDPIILIKYKVDGKAHYSIGW